MPRESYAENVQIKQVHFTAQEVRNILLENLVNRASTPYDFDYQNPMIITEKDGSIIMRFAPLKITSNSGSSLVVFKPL